MLGSGIKAKERDGERAHTVAKHTDMPTLRAELNKKFIQMLNQKFKQKF